MGDFGKIANEITDVIRENRNNTRGIGVKDISKIVGKSTKHRIGEVNCYPGIPGAKCKEEAFFVSLTSKASIKKRRGHLSFSAALSSIVRHMQGNCANITRSAIFITDSWDSNAYDVWKENIREISKNSNLEIYLMAPGGNLEIRV